MTSSIFMAKLHAKLKKFCFSIFQVIWGSFDMCMMKSTLFFIQLLLTPVANGPKCN